MAGIVAASTTDRVFQAVPLISGLVVTYIAWRLTARSDWLKWRQDKRLDVYQHFLTAGEASIVTAQRLFEERASRAEFDESVASLTLAETAVALLGDEPMTAAARSLYDQMAGDVRQMADAPMEALTDTLQPVLEARRLLARAVEAARADLAKPPVRPIKPWVKP